MSDRRHRILVVDDRAENLLAAEVALGGVDAEIVTAQSGEEALLRLLESEYSLLLLDIQMPGLDGYETAKLIRARTKTRNLPIIFLTAHDTESKNILRAYEELNGIDMLFKPLAPQILRAKVNVILALQDRTAEKRELERLNEQLAEADQRKNEFLAILAHELRNPLAPLRALFDLTKQQPNQPLPRRMAEIGDRQVNILARLVDDLLDISRITANKISLRPEVTDLREVVELALSTSRPRITDRKHQLITHFGDRKVPVTVDSLRIVQVVSNLLNNAARYTPVGGRIELSCGLHGQVAYVEVTDNGIGIPDELIPTIFDMFVQERVRSDGTGGLGLGLALARQLVDLHGGKLRASSPGRGRGSTFRLELPCAESEHALRPRVRTKEIEPMSVATVPHKKSVVIVDDNDDARELVGHLLEAAGHHVHLAPDGPRGLESILEHRPDCALIDIGLPGMTGFELVDALRSRCPDLPTRLVALTGYCAPDSVAKAKQAGFHEHLVKPATLEVMLRALGE